MKRKTEHTKGPWKAEDEGDYADFDGESIVIIGDSMRIAAVHSTEGSGLSNARLIASAPDMLKRLSQIAWIVEDVETRCLAADGDVITFREEVTESEIRKISKLAKGRK